MIQPATTSPSSSLALGTGAQTAPGDGAGVSASFAALLSSSLPPGPDDTGTGAGVPNLAVDTQAGDASGKPAGKSLPLDLPELDAALAVPAQPAGIDASLPGEAGVTVLRATAAEAVLSGLALLRKPQPAAMPPAPASSTMEAVVPAAGAPATPAPVGETIGTAPAAGLAAKTSPQTIRARRVDGVEPAVAEKPEDSSTPVDRPDADLPTGPAGGAIPPPPLVLVAMPVAERGMAAQPASSTPATVPDRRNATPANAGAQLQPTPVPGTPPRAAAPSQLPLPSAPGRSAAVDQAVPAPPAGPSEPAPAMTIPVRPETAAQAPADAAPLATTNSQLIGKTVIGSVPAATQSRAPAEPAPATVLTPAPTPPTDGAISTALAAAPKVRTVDAQSVPTASSAADATAAPDAPAKIAPASADRAATPHTQPIATQAAAAQASAPQPSEAAPDRVVPEAQPVLTAPAAAQPVVAAAPVPAAEPARQAGHDFAALVDRLVEAREAAVPQAVHAAVAHREFGQVSLRFEQDAAGLSVAMSSSDPEFARAVQAGAAAAGSQTASDNGSAAPRQDSPAQHQTAGSPSGQPQSQANSQASARNDRNAPARAEAAPHADRQGPDHQSTDAGGDIYA